jgi:nucleoside-diphosphate-sugar epimerase
MEQVTGCRARVCKEKARQVDVGVNILDSTRAQQYLGWEATTALEEGLLNTWNWIQTRPRTISAGTP